MNKFQRNYKLVYTTPGDDNNTPVEIIINYPIMVQFDINRNTFSQANTANFQLYNLEPSTREQMFQDKYRIDRNCFVKFYAGYGDNMPLIFSGKVLECYSSKSNTNVITRISALDNDIIQSYSSHTFEAGTPKKDVLKTLVSDMPNVQLGAVGTLEGSLQNRYIVEDRTFVAINKLTGNHAFVDLDKLNVLQENETLGDINIYKLTSDTGLLGTPERRDAQVVANAVFSSEIIVGQLLEIESSTAPVFNGQFKVVGLQHSGVISGATCGEVRTTLNLFIGALLPNSNQIFTGVSYEQPLSEVKGKEVTPVDGTVLSSVKQVRQYLINNGKPPTDKITKNIAWNEVLMNYSQQGEIPSLKVLSNLVTLATRVQDFLDKFYPSNKIIITSGWRSKTYNSRIPNAHPNSSHIYGYAMDFYIPGQIIYYVYKDVQRFWSGRSYAGSGFIHVDITVGGGKIANDR